VFLFLPDTVLVVLLLQLGRAWGSWHSPSKKISV